MFNDNDELEDNIQKKYQEEMLRAINSLCADFGRKMIRKEGISQHMAALYVTTAINDFQTSIVCAAFDTEEDRLHVMETLNKSSILKVKSISDALSKNK